jgi:hypothetical protein
VIVQIVIIMDVQMDEKLTEAFVHSA